MNCYTFGRREGVSLRISSNSITLPNMKRHDFINSVQNLHENFTDWGLVTVEFGDARESTINNNKNFNMGDGF